MRNLVMYSLLIFVLSLGVSVTSYAQCVIIGTTPGGGDIVNCTGNDNNGLLTTEQPDVVTVQPGASVTSTNQNGTIDTSDDDDIVNVLGGFINNTNSDMGPDDPDGINGGGGNDTFNVSGGTINARQDCIEGNSGNDTFNISGGVLECEDDGLCGDDGEDVFNVTGGRIASTVDDDGIAGGEGDDVISVSNATVEKSPEDDDFSINGGEDSDTVKIGNGAILIGPISGGQDEDEDDIDTLIFEMQVPADQIAGICAQLEAANPELGSIVINNLFYEWEDFEVIECNISGGFASPVPTLSQWGLIAMASILGIVGFMVARRRKLTA